MIFLTILAIGLPIIFFAGYGQKDFRTYSFFIWINYFFILSVMCTQFLVIKFSDGHQLVFPDEYLYVHDNTSTLLFSYYVRSLTYFDLDFVRAINVIVFTLSLSILTSEIVTRVNKHYKIIVILCSIFGSIVGGYWSFFILKEAFTVAALSLLVISHIKRNKTLLIIACVFLFFARVDLLVLYFFISIILFLKEKSNFFYYLSVILIIMLFVYFMNSDYSYSFKLFTLSRRLGEEDFVYDDIAVNTSKLGFISFVFSEAFVQAINTNINSTFNPFVNLNPLVMSQRFFNFFALLVMILCSKSYLFKNKIYTFAFTIVVGLLCTHSVYRYLNSILIPLTIYFIYLFFLSKEKV